MRKESRKNFLIQQKNLSDSMEYSLYFDIFEDPDRNEYAIISWDKNPMINS